MGGGKAKEKGKAGAKAPGVGLLALAPALPLAKPKTADKSTPGLRGIVKGFAKKKSCHGWLKRPWWHHSCRSCGGSIARHSRADNGSGNSAWANDASAPRGSASRWIPSFQRRLRSWTVRLRGQPWRLPRIPSGHLHVTGLLWITQRWPSNAS